MSGSLSSLPFKQFVFYRPGDESGGLNALIANAGHEALRPGAAYAWDGTRRGASEMLIWQYTIAGRGKVSCGGKTFDVLPGEAMLLKVPEKHRYWLPEDSEGWEFIFLTLSGSEVMRLGMEARKRLGVVIRHAAYSGVVRTASSILSESLADRLKSRFEISGRAYAFMMALLSETNSREPKPSGFPLEAAREHCLAHIAEPLTVDDLAKSVNLSRWHFSRSFRKATGIAPHQYILEAKMGLASHLLLNTRYSVKEVACRCGFEDASYFCKTFKKTHGSAPGEFRAR